MNETTPLIEREEEISEHGPIKINPNPFQYITVSWLNPLLSIGSKRPLVQNDLYELADHDKVDAIAESNQYFQEQYKLYTNNPNVKNKPSLAYAIVKSIFWPLLGSGVCAWVGTILNLMFPLALQQMIQFVDPANNDKLWFDSGYAIAGVLFLLSIVDGFIITCEAMTARRYHQITYSYLVNSIVEKSLRLTPKARLEFPESKILNLIGQDISSIIGAISSFDGVITLPIDFSLTLYLIYSLIGKTILFSLLIMIFITSFTAYMSPKVGKLFSEYVEAGDKRIGAIREMLYGIKTIKFHAGEKIFVDRIQKARDSQLHSLNRRNRALIILQVTTVSSMMIMMVVSMVAYSSFGNVITADVVFPVILYFTRLEGPFDRLSWTVSALTSGNKSVHRIWEFLMAEELSDVHTIQPDLKSDISISAENVNWKWESLKVKGEEKETDALIEEQLTVEEFELKDINIKIKKGSLVAIVGPVGCGKSTFLSSIVGETTHLSGAFSVNGSLALCTQQPWILTGSIEHNITFNSPLDSERLNQVVHSCGMVDDLNMLPDRLSTEIGESGVNLSGGQKARVALARALYSNADIYLLDDPLSALDTQVGRKVFNEAIKGQLSKKTVLLVTHQLQYLKQVDQIIVFKDGNVVETGTFDDLISKENSSLNELLKSHTLEDDHQHETSTLDKVDDKEKEKKADDFIEKEEIKEGSVKLSVYKSYIKAMGNEYIRFFLFGISCLFLFAAKVLQPLLLAKWSSDSENSFTRFYLYSYVILGVTDMVSYGLLFSIAIYLTVKASCYFHDKAIEGVTNSPMNIFDTNPIGRIINRLTSDVETTDNELWEVITSTLQKMLELLATLFLISQVSHYLILFFIFIAAMYISIFQYFQKSYLQVKRIGPTLKSSLDALVNETLTGVSTVKAYKQEEIFVKSLRHLIDQYRASVYLQASCYMWFFCRTKVISALVMLPIALVGAASEGHSTYFAAAIALALSNASQLSPIMNYILYSMSTIEASLNSVERLHHYASNLEQEQERVLETDPSKECWPKSGEIEVQGLDICYPSRPDSPVIKNLSFKVNAGENIGIVGRTGSGKSTLMNTFFRIMEPSKGTIVIDGIDIRTLGLETLRKGLEMIPQDPVLFEGSIRSNLDLYDQFGDDKLWEALSFSGLNSYVNNLALRLDAPVTKGGDNMSIGQRQLLCLSRSILLKPKILVMDEATASIDGESDKLIQDAIKLHFQDTTIISIAHRLNTVIEFDKILVLDNGKLVEYDTPKNLLSDPTSSFYQFAAATGKNNLKLLCELAKGM